MKTAWLVLICALLAACGSGSTQSGGTGGKNPGATVQTARVDIATLGPTAATVLYAAQFTLDLPPWVELPASQEGGLLPAGVLVPAPAGSFAGATYLPASGGAAASVQVNVTHPTGFTVGPLATLNCMVGEGMEITADSFALKAFSARDSNGMPLPEITAHLTLLTQ